jgi:hypothetical protein
LRVSFRFVRFSARLNEDVLWTRFQLPLTVAGKSRQAFSELKAIRP